MNTPHNVFRTNVHVRWGDQDIYGHVNNARLVVLIEEARIDWLHDTVRQSGVADFAGPRLVASLNVDYKRPVMFGTDVEVNIWISHIGTTSYRLDYTARQGGEEVFSASTVIVALAADPTPQSSTPDRPKPRPLTAAERQYLEDYLKRA